ncbi:MAG: OmpH family outer membrane protein [Bacteroidetes bacterium]|nr:OmpH family outer membrane protein [Bacteroidota bacterium]
MKLNIVNTLLLVGILAYLVIGQMTSEDVKKQAYVVTGELFAEFEYQKELDSEYKTLKEKKDQELALYRNDLIMLENKIRSGQATEEEVMTYQQGFEQFRNMEYQVNEELAKVNGEYSLQIWNKLNAFIKSYGEENGYDVIFGAGGEGNIMYATENLNITTDVIAYCNNKYNGK